MILFNYSIKRIQYINLVETTDSLPLMKPEGKKAGTDTQPALNPVTVDDTSAHSPTYYQKNPNTLY